MDHDPEKAFRLILGGVDKYVKQQGRNTVMENAYADSAEVGWARVAGPDACEFCRMQSSRGFAFKSELSAGGGRKHGGPEDHFHPYCSCGIAVAFRDRRGRIRAEGADGEIPEDWDPAALYDELAASGRKFKHNRTRENARKRGRRFVRYRAETSVPAGRNLFLRDDPLFDRIQKMKPEPGYESYYDVGIHSDGREFIYGHLHKEGDIHPEITISVEMLAKLIKQDSGYAGEPIRLVSCYAGKYADGVAKQLAVQLGVPVRAPNKRVYIDFDGQYRLANSDWENSAIIDGMLRETGRWETFSPD